ncbi:hypothetical protein [Polluticaenibacter yanchengensis]|uniref:Prolyl-tRNA synthetase n=1 Tax=Polluticaenibacter yanchengensis TaxID=3014562 RepID=A0ABT4UNG9_9BACT|nr:hypothetical protein [Chitinophagaceae bacterium LY-5]
MKNKFLILLGLGGLLASCSSVYKSGQTPDDLYYAESPAITANVRASNVAEDDYVSGEDGEYRSLWGDSDDNYLRQKVSNGGKWNSIDDNNYWNGYTYASGSVYNPYMYGNSFNSWNSYWNTGFYNYNSMWGFSPLSIRFGSPFYYGMGMGFMNDPFWGWNSGFYPGMFAYNRFGGYYGGYYNYYGGVGNGGYWGNNGTKPNPIYRNTTRPSSLSRYSNNNGFSRMNTQSASSSGRNSGTYRSVFGNNNGPNSGSSYERPARTFNTGSSNSGGSFGGGSSSGSSGGSSRSTGGGNTSRGGR